MVVAGCHKRAFPRLFVLPVALGLLSVPLLPLEGSASDSIGGFTIVMGGNSCGKYLQSDPQDRRYYYEWLAGYLTAFNQLKDRLSNVLKLTDFAGMGGEVDNYCRAHPATGFAEAVIVVVNSYYREHKNQLDEP